MALFFTLHLISAPVKVHLLNLKFNFIIVLVIFNFKYYPLKLFPNFSFNYKLINII
jgi:hypothetical protein